MRRWRPGALARAERGSVTLLAAAGLTLAMAASALAVDLGSVYYEARRLQGIADAAALSAAGNLASADEAMVDAITASGWDRSISAQIATGTWTPDASLPVARRFTAGGSVPNAARVSASEDSPLYFGRIFGLRTVHLIRTATAARIDLASFSIGSRLASLDGGIGNQLLSALTGSSISLTAADYNALLGADVDLLSFAPALQTELHATGASYQQTLATSTTLPHALAALAAALNASGSGDAATAIGKIAASVGNTPVTLSSLVDLGPIGKQDYSAGGTSLDVNAFDMLTTLLEIAGGARQVQLDLAAGVPGLTSLKATLAIGDRAATSPWVAVTASGDPIVRTAQTRLYLEATVGGSTLLKALGVQSVRLPLYVELAAAQARLSSLSCPAGSRSATLSVQPSIGHASIADVATTNLSSMSVAPTESPATLVNVLGVKASGSARTDLSDNGWQTVSFDTADIDSRATKTVNSTGTASAIATSLIGKVSVSTSVGPLQLPSLPLGAALSPLLATTAPLIDGALSPLLDALGVHLGQADVRIDGVRCGAAALVA